MKNIERSIGVKEAIKKANSIIKKLNTKFEIEKINTVNNKYYTTIVYSINDDIVGCGKGVDDQSLASGLFEYIEHYITNEYSIKEINNIENIFFELKKEIKNDNLFEKFFEIKTDDDYFECLNFYEYKDNYMIKIPKFLCLNVRKKEEKYMKLEGYISNNGIAIGVNKQEALLHALNEIIERNSLSYHFLEVFMMGKGYIKINEGTLPNNLKEIFVEIEREIKSKVNIIKIKNDYGLYVYLVYSRNKNKIIKGSGCSISSNYALERALLECLQMYHAMNSDEYLKDKQKYDLFKKLKLNKYIDILTLNYNDKKFTIEDFVENENIYLSIEEMISKIINKIYEKGYKVFISELKKMEECVCIKVIIPNFERFHLVSEGKVILPNKENLSKILKYK